MAFSGYWLWRSAEFAVGLLIGLVRMHHAQRRDLRWQFVYPDQLGEVVPGAQRDDAERGAGCTVGVTERALHEARLRFEWLRAAQRGA